MSLFYDPGNANVVVDNFSRFCMGILSHVDEKKSGLVHNIHWLTNLGVHLLELENSGVIIQEVAMWSLGAEVNVKYVMDPILMQDMENVGQ